MAWEFNNGQHFWVNLTAAAVNLISVRASDSVGLEDDTHNSTCSDPYIRHRLIIAKQAVSNNDFHPSSSASILVQVSCPSLICCFSSLPVVSGATSRQIASPFTTSAETLIAIMSFTDPEVESMSRPICVVNLGATTSEELPKMHSHRA